MGFIYKKIDEILKRKNLSYRQLSKLIDEYDSNFKKMIKGKRNFKKEVVTKLSPILEVSKQELESWIFADKYSKELLEKAIYVKKHTKKQEKEKILTVKIDEILAEKGITRNALGTIIKYNHAGVRRMIIGEIGMSKPVMEKIAPVLGISPDELQAWAIADKYSLKKLEQALEVHQEVK